MPKIQIKEYDRTGRVQAGVISNTVYVPIRFNTDPNTHTQITKDIIADNVKNSWVEAADIARISRFSDIALFRSVREFEDAASGKIKTSSSVLTAAENATRQVNTRNMISLFAEAAPTATSSTKTATNTKWVKGSSTDSDWKYYDTKLQAYVYEIRGSFTTENEGQVLSVAFSPAPIATRSSCWIDEDDVTHSTVRWTLYTTTKGGAAAATIEYVYDPSVGIGRGERKISGTTGATGDTNFAVDPPDTVYTISGSFPLLSKLLPADASIVAIGVSDTAPARANVHGNATVNTITVGEAETKVINWTLSAHNAPNTNIEGTVKYVYTYEKEVPETPSDEQPTDPTNPDPVTPTPGEGGESGGTDPVNPGGNEGGDTEPTTPGTGEGEGDEDTNPETPDPVTPTPGGTDPTPANPSQESITIIDTNSLGYKLCVHLLKLGYEILVEALPDVPQQKVINGALVDDMESNKPSWKKLIDKNLYDVRFLTLGAFTESVSYATIGNPSAPDGYNIVPKSGFDMTGQVTEMLKVAEARGDCIALVNADENNPGFKYDVTEVRKQLASDLNVLKECGPYAAAFTPWFYTNNPDFAEFDKIPAAFGYLFAYANARKNNPEWYAVAGFERGVIPELSRVCHAYSTSEVEHLQARSETGEVELDAKFDNVGVAINPICYVRPAGYIIYGNRTLKVNTEDKKLTAQSFLNVRNGLSAVKKLMYEAAKKYTFEQNTEALWINFQSYVTPLLDRMQSGNGILGYTFVRQKTNAKARLKARLNLVPVEAVEDFDLEVYLTDDLTVSE